MKSQILRIDFCLIFVFNMFSNVRMELMVNLSVS